MYHPRSDRLDAPSISPPCFPSLDQTAAKLNATRSVQVQRVQGAQSLSQAHGSSRMSEQHRAGLWQAEAKAMVAQGGHLSHSLLTAGSMPALPSMASGKQDPPSPHPLPQPAAVTMCNTSLSSLLHFPASTRNIYHPSPSKESCHFANSLALDIFNVQDTSGRPEDEGEEPAT